MLLAGFVLAAFGERSAKAQEPTGFSRLNIYAPDRSDFTNSLTPGLSYSFQWYVGTGNFILDTGKAVLRLPPHLKINGWVVKKGMVKSVEVSGQVVTMVLNKNDHPLDPLGNESGGEVWISVTVASLADLPDVAPELPCSSEFSASNTSTSVSRTFTHPMYLLYSKLTLTSNAGDPVKPGDTIIYTLTTSNYPHGNIADARINLDAPEGTDIVIGSVAGVGGAQVTETAGRVTLVWGADAPRQHTLSYAVKVRERSALPPHLTEIHNKSTGYTLAMKVNTGGDYDPAGTKRRTYSATTVNSQKAPLEPVFKVTLGLSRRGVPLDGEFKVKAHFENTSPWQLTEAKLDTSSFQYEGEGEVTFVGGPASGLTLAAGQSGDLEYRFKGTGAGKLKISATGTGKAQTYQAFAVTMARASTPRLCVGCTGVEAEIILPAMPVAVNTPITVQVEFVSYEEKPQTVSFNQEVLFTQEPERFGIEAEILEPFTLTGDDPVRTFEVQVTPLKAGSGLVFTEAEIREDGKATTISAEGEIITSPLAVKLTALPLIGGKPLVNMELKEDGTVVDEDDHEIEPKLKVVLENLSDKPVTARLDVVDPHARDTSGVVGARIAVTGVYPVDYGTIPPGGSVAKELPIAVQADGRFDFIAHASGLSQGSTRRFTTRGQGAPVAVGDPFPVQVDLTFVRTPNITEQNNGAFFMVPGSSLEVHATVTNLTTNSTVKFHGIQAEKHLNAMSAVLTDDEGHQVDPPFAHFHELKAAENLLLTGRVMTDPEGAPSGTVKWLGLKDATIMDDKTRKERELKDNDILMNSAAGGWLNDPWQARIIQDNRKEPVPPQLTGLETVANYSYGTMLSVGQYMYDSVDGIGGFGRVAGNIAGNPSLLADTLGEGSRVVWEAAEYAALGWSSMTENQKQEFVLGIATETQRRFGLRILKELPVDANDFNAVLNFTRNATYGLFSNMEQAYAENDPVKISQEWGKVSGNVAMQVAAAAMPAPKFNQYVKAADAALLAKAGVLGKAENVQEFFLRKVLSGPVDEVITGKHWGVDGEYLQSIRDVFKRFGVKGYMRERAPESILLIDKLKEAIWKPEAMKPKGLSDVDLLILDNDLPPILGSNKKPLDPKGITMIFMPESDDVIRQRLASKGAPQDLIDVAITRAQMRRKEFQKYVPEFEAWAAPVSEGGGIPIAKNYKDNGVPDPTHEFGTPRAFRFERHRRAGKPTIYIPRMMDETGSAFKYISGDVDWIHFTFLDGRPLDVQTAKRLYDAMSRSCGFQHPETISWILNGATVFEGKIEQIVDYLKAATPGGQKALLEVTGDGMRAVRINEKLSRFGKTGRAHLISFDGGFKSRTRAVLADVEDAFAYFQQTFPNTVFVPPAYFSELGEDPATDEWTYTSSEDAKLVRPSGGGSTLKSRARAASTMMEVFDGTTWVEVPLDSLPRPLKVTPHTQLASDVAAGATTLPLVDLLAMYPGELASHVSNWFAVGQTLIIAPGEPNQETVKLIALNPVKLEAPLQYAHAEGTLVAVLPGTGPTTSEGVNPVIKLTSKGGKSPSGAYIVSGTAKDNEQVARVEISINGGAPVLADLGAIVDGRQTFFLDLALENGRNTIVITAYDFAGNASQLGKVKVSNVSQRPELAGKYQGLITSAGAPAQSRTGMITLVVSSTGSFTGKVTFGDWTQAVKGLVDNAGVARFKPTGDTTAAPKTLELVRKSRKSPLVSLGNLSFALTEGGATGLIKDATGGVLSNLAALRAYFDGKTPETSVAATYLENKGRYTAFFPTRTSQAGLTAADFPNGYGYGNFSVSKKGGVKFAGKLADGTAFSAGALLSQDYVWPLYARLYNGGGAIFGAVTLDDTQAESDFSGEDLLWLRPTMGISATYPNGWPKGIRTNLLGARYMMPKGTSVLAGLAAVSETGNAGLAIFGGSLTELISKSLNVAPDNKTSSLSGDKTFAVKINAKSGLLSGSFTHESGAKVSWSGIIYQKGTTPDGWGFFVEPKPDSGTARAGAVKLFAK